MFQKKDLVVKNYLHKLVFVFIAFFLLFNSTEGKAMEDNAFSFNFESIKQSMPLMNTKVRLYWLSTPLLNVVLPQYEGLQSVWEEYKDKGLMVIGVIKQFWFTRKSKVKLKNFVKQFGINFPMTTKEDVKGENAHPFYKWLKSEYGNSK